MLPAAFAATMTMKIHPLTISSAAPVRLSSNDPAATVWEAGEHAPQVILQRLGDWCWVEVDGVASYRFPAEAAGLEVRAEAFSLAGRAAEGDVSRDPPSTDPVDCDQLTDLYYRTVVPLALQVYGLESMHGTAVQHGHAAVLLCAPSRTGKSTLAAALAADGAKVIADDGLVWDAPIGGRGALLHPVPFSLMLREASAKHFIDARAGERAARRANPPVEVDPVPIRLVLLLERSDTGEIASQRLGPREAFTRLLAPSYAVSLADKSRKGRMMAAYLRFAAAVPVYSLTYPTGLDRLPEVTAQVERIVASAQTEDQAGNSKP